MKISCQCGCLIVDGTDSLPHKAHIVADRDWFDLLEGIDAVIENCGKGEEKRGKACMRVRELLVGKTRSAWQCSGCGMLYLDDGAGGLCRFKPVE